MSARRHGIRVGGEKWTWCGLTYMAGVSTYSVERGLEQTGITCRSCEKAHGVWLDYMKKVRGL